MARFSHIAGDTALDLINTVEWRLGGPQREEDLLAYADVLEWCEESGLVTPPERTQLRALAEAHPRVATRELATVIEAREAAYEALIEHDEKAGRRLGELFAESVGRAELQRDGDSWTWRERDLELTVPRDRVVRALVVLAQRDDLDRLHQCEDAKCGWVYLDTSPRRNRRWCVTKDCGDRNRSRAYYARKKAADAGGDA